MINSSFLFVRFGAVLLGAALVATALGCAKEADPSPPATAVVGTTPAAPPVASAPKTPLEEAGLPLYPGATKVSLLVAKPAPNGSKRVQAEYSTKDTPDKVAQFYKDKVGLMEGGMGKLVQLVGKTSKGLFVQILINANGGKTKIQYYFVLPPTK